MPTNLRVSAGDILRELEAIRDFVFSRPIAGMLVDAGNALNCRAVDRYFEDNFIGKGGRVVSRTLSADECVLFKHHPTVEDHHTGAFYYKSIEIGRRAR